MCDLNFCKKFVKMKGFSSAYYSNVNKVSLFISENQSYEIRLDDENLDLLDVWWLVWMDNLNVPNYVQFEKNSYMNDIKAFLQGCFKSDDHPGTCFYISRPSRIALIKCFFRFLGGVPKLHGCHGFCYQARLFTNQRTAFTNKMVDG